MTRYRIKMASPQIYIVDTDAGTYMPEVPGAKPHPLEPFWRMNPEDKSFACRVVEVERDGRWVEPDAAPRVVNANKT